ncbi:hypothetical protein [Phytohabitans rumicis]|uniref:Uncharacterized protein n=1 Tax=Phytohabitans rumicis TaxID=1076125 RepID=A0A6V8L8W1_9ACTN|nr:hypothetical protein [Phytohabitans rumicis]GFJ93683.1 hypothetical protein Prum_073250 [Phytohabitans rumicis]
MTAQVVHHERLAWDAARAFICATESDQVFGWLREQVERHFDRRLAEALYESRHRLWARHRLDVVDVERGRWRAKLEDLVIADRSRALPLQQLIAETSARLAQATDIRAHGQPRRADGPHTIDLDRPSDRLW